MAVRCLHGPTGNERGISVTGKMVNPGQDEFDFGELFKIDIDVTVDNAASADLPEDLWLVPRPDYLADLRSEQSDQHLAIELFHRGRPGVVFIVVVTNFTMHNSSPALLLLP